MFYTHLSAIYDAWVADFDYEKVVSCLQRILREDISSSNVLEVGCGTGNLARCLVKAGAKVTGIDISAEMLALAAEKDGWESSPDYVHLDASQEAWPDGPFDAVVCIFDTVNYFDRDEFCHFSSEAVRTLKPGGALLFDINTPNKIVNLFGQSQFGDTHEAWAYIWKNNLSSDQKVIDYYITIFLEVPSEADDGCIDQDARRYRRVQETHRQYVHQPEDLAAQLRAIGFDEIVITDDYGCQPGNENSHRMTISCVKR